MSDKSDWDASDSEPSTSKATTNTSTPVVVAAPRKSKFADEDASDSDVKDDWDASDDSDDDEKKASKPAGPAPPLRQKGITKQKIAEKEAAERARADELAARRNQDPNEKRAADRAAQLRADMDNAAALFGQTAISSGGDDVFSMPLRTSADADALATKLSDIIVGKYADLPNYSVFLKTFVRELNLPLKDIQVREVASNLTALANEKQKAQKEAAGGKKKSKAAGKPVLGASKGIGAGRVDTRAYEDVLDDSGEFDDFVGR